MNSLYKYNYTLNGVYMICEDGNMMFDKLTAKCKLNVIFIELQSEAK